MDPAKAKAEKEEREREERLAREAEEAAIKAKILAEENKLRLIHLQLSYEIIQKYDQQLQTLLIQQTSIDEWNSFIKCKEIPDLKELKFVNSYFTEWCIWLEEKGVKLEMVVEQIPSAIELLQDIQNLIDLPPPTVSVNSLYEFSMIYHKFKRKLQYFLDKSTYNILINLGPFYDPEVGLIESTLLTKEIVHSLWCNYYSCPEYSGHYFEPANFRFKLPESLILTKGLYRLLKLEYDHYSDSSSTFYPPKYSSFLQPSAIENWISKRSISTPKSFIVNFLENLVVKDVGVQVEAVKGEEFSKKVDELRLESMNKKEENGEPIESENRKLTSPTFLNPSTRPNQQDETTSTIKEQKLSSCSDEKGSKSLERPKSPKGEEIVVVTAVCDKQGDASEQMVDDSTMSEKLDKNVKTMEKELDPEEKLKEPNQSSNGNEKDGISNVDSEKKPEDSSSTSQQEPKSKGKRGKGKGGNNKETRTKSEAELAKERERKEKAQFIPILIHPNELNLRNYVILGGVYDFKLLLIPPQPREAEDNGWTLHLIENEEHLKEILFVADYIPPPPIDLQEVKKTPEEMEREAKRQEEELQKLVLVEIKVPKTALWFEPPTIVRWIDELQIWSSNGFYDVKFNEDSLQLSFRTTMFGIIGLGHNRWCNLPYQSWELRPSGKNKVTLSLMAAMAVLEFTVHNNVVAVTSLQNVSNSDVIESLLIDRYMKPRELIQALRYHGIDVFPEFDSYAYVDGILVKHQETEEHLYQCMAITAVAFNFQWSRWNLLAGRNKMVYQVRERLGTTTPGNYHMVLTTPRSAALIDCTEVSPNYSEEPAGEYEYHADVLHLIQSIASKEAQEAIDEGNGFFIETLRTLLSGIKCLSYS